MSYLKHLESLEDKFGRLDELPESLYAIIVTHSHGILNDRIKGILQWRDAFFQGELPDEQTLVWPESSIRRMVLKRLESLEIVQYCNDQPELTDAILKDVCDAITTAEQWQQIDPGFDDKLAKQQKQRDRDSPFKDSENDQFSEQNQTDGTTEYLDEQNNSLDHSSNNLSEIASDSFSAFESMNNKKISALDLSEVETDVGTVPTIDDLESTYSSQTILEAHWQELSEQWQELSSVFSELSGFLGRGWDLTQGLLASQGWRDIIRYRRLVRELPWLEHVIEALGRMKEISSEESTIMEQVFEPVKRLVDEDVEVPTPDSVYETSGIRRSDDISRLIPGELSQLGHPQLNLLWHAKRAEHTLLTYQVDGVMSEHEPVEQEVLEEVTRTKPESQQGYGPIIVCLDGSASMQGEPENIAKALVLEAMNIAWQENRDCYVYLFSGPEQTLEHQLDMTHGGLSELLKFLTQTFHGGTDVIEPLMQAISRQKEEAWEKSDILLVTDGRFPLSSEKKQLVNTMRKHSQSRIHGVLIGQWRGSSMQSVCDNFHRIASV